MSRPGTKHDYHVLNLGAGVQSTALYLMAREKLYGLSFDAAVFADTGDEPKAVYDHVEWLRSLGDPPILVGSAGNIHDDLMRCENSTRQRFASIPVYTRHDERKPGRTRRQCTHEYKIAVVERMIRRTIVGLAPRRRFPMSVQVHQYFGITVDESRRAMKIINRMPRWSTAHFPLLDKGWSRRGVIEWLKHRVPHPVPRSACVICPLRNDREWAEMKRDRPDEFERACVVDEHLRAKGAIVNRKMNSPLYLHRSCIPLRMVDFDRLPPQTLDGFTLFDCSGACGQ